MWAWLVTSIEDAALSLRTAAGIAEPKKAVELLQRADALMSDGPEAAPTVGGRDEALAAWEEAHGKHDSPEVRAKVAAAAAALARREREQADTAAQKSIEQEARAADAQRRRRRRGRRD